MRILIFTDPHWSSFSSIVRNRGTVYTARLENLIKSINWVEQLALFEHCDAIFCLGDFFDKNEQTAEELTALKEIKWSGISHCWLVGNHEISRGSLEFSTAHLFSLCQNSTIIDNPCNFDLPNEDTEICFLPYISSLKDKSNIKDYFEDIGKFSRRIVFSHNDLKGIQYGAFVSKEGFELSDIENYCDLFINGHLHNGEKITSKIVNLGNLTGQNFGEDANKYSHCVAILDTETLHMDYYENPFAFNFYKYTATNLDDFTKFISTIKNNAVLTVKANEEIYADVKTIISKCESVVDSRVLLDIERKGVSDTIEISELAKIDHIQSFKDYILNNLGNSQIIQEELQEISE